LSDHIRVQMDTTGLEVLLFWLDLCESEKSSDGSMYMVGKTLCANTGQYVSCCVEICGATRIVYFLLRDGVDTGLACDEIKSLIAGSGVPECSLAPVVRHYAFGDKTVPASGRYIEATYSAAYPQLSTRLAGSTFSRVFGTAVSPIERFVMACPLMGPSWVRVSRAIECGGDQSWCRLNLRVSSPKDIAPEPCHAQAPPITMLSLALLTAPGQHGGCTEIVAAGGAIVGNACVHAPADYRQFSIITRYNNLAFPFNAHLVPNTQLVASERGLLSVLLAKLDKIDPDVIVGHGLMDYGIDVLMHRLAEFNVAGWSRIGRLRRVLFPKLAIGSTRASYQERAALGGRIVCDIKICAREFALSLDTDLGAMALCHLGVTRADIDPSSLAGSYRSVDGISDIAARIAGDAGIVAQLTARFDLIQLCMQMANITGGLLSRTCVGGAAERNDTMLCHEFHNRQYIFPDKHCYQRGTTDVPRQQHESFTGGLVLEPKRGLYTDGVAVLDFNSLYPSIIREHNVCFTTLDPADPGATVDVPGVLPAIVKLLVDRRKSVKRLMAQEQAKQAPDHTVLLQLDTRQKALKLTANSIYGCLGFYSSRFYARHLAEFIALKGREALTAAVGILTGQFAADVIYGDTDSVMISMKMADADEIHSRCTVFAKAICSAYTHLEIGIDHIFKTMLLLNKKKYAAVELVQTAGGAHTAVRHVKGLDMVRRDWCELSRTVGSNLLDMIMSGDKDGVLIDKCRAYMSSVYADICAGAIPVHMFVIRKALSCAPETYPATPVLPHVRVALIMQSRGKVVNSSDTIQYVVCNDGTSNQPSQRAYPPEDVGAGVLRIDSDYYISAQIIPSITRLFGPVHGVDDSLIAGCFGVSPPPARPPASVTGDTPASDTWQASDISPLRVCCNVCKTRWLFPSSESVGLACPACGNVLDAVYLCNLLTMEVRALFAMYHSSEFECTDQTCRLRSRSLQACGPVCLDPNCREPVQRVYSWDMFRLRVLHLMAMFDDSHAIRNRVPIDTAQTVHAHMVGIARRYSCAVVKLDALFARPDSLLNEHRSSVSSAMRAEWQVIRMFIDTEQIPATMLAVRRLQRPSQLRQYPTLDSLPDHLQRFLELPAKFDVRRDIAVICAFVLTEKGAEEYFARLSTQEHGRTRCREVKDWIKSLLKTTQSPEGLVHALSMRLYKQSVTK
jgi:DNA polymerase alpha subunit A